MAAFEAVHRYLATLEEAQKHPYKPSIKVSIEVHCIIIGRGSQGYMYGRGYDRRRVMRVDRGASKEAMGRR